MSFYVKIRRLYGSNDYARLGDWLVQSGIKEVDYHKGGWADHHINNIHPHLKFEKEVDALAFVLTHGGVYTTKIPEDVNPTVG